jgi:hypothetical protein
MTNRTHVTLRVELDPQDGSIAGCVLDGAGAGRSFAGWMGLAAAIEDALPGGAGRGTETEHADEQAAPRSRTGSGAAAKAGGSSTARIHIGLEER